MMHKVTLTTSEIALIKGALEHHSKALRASGDAPRAEHLLFIRTLLPPGPYAGFEPTVESYAVEEGRL